VRVLRAEQGGSPTPYIDPARRLALDYTIPAQTAGELNFAITRIVDSYLERVGLRYEYINAVIGVLECAKLELYRRVAVPYEDGKCAANGDVYTVVPGTSPANECFSGGACACRELSPYESAAEVGAPEETCDETIDTGPGVCGRASGCGGV